MFREFLLINISVEHTAPARHSYGYRARQFCVAKHHIICWTFFDGLIRPTIKLLKRFIDVTGVCFFFHLHHSDQQLLNVFEVVVSTLEGKLERIDHLDRAVEHLMKRVEQLDNRMVDNIDKTDSVIAKLRQLDTHITDATPPPEAPTNIFGKSMRSVGGGHGGIFVNSNQLDSKLVSLDQKVSDIDFKLGELKSQIDTNFLSAVDELNAEASEKKPISMNVLEITRSMNADVISHVTNEMSDLKSTTDAMDKKLQFHINLVSENIARVLRIIGDIHEAVVEHNDSDGAYNATTTTTTTTHAPPTMRTSKIDALVNQMKPIMSVSEKMDEVWDVVVGTKSSVDDLLPKSDELLTQTQRQERAIGEIHHDLKTKTNLIINNLDIVEKRLKKQEDDVAVLAQRPVPQDLLMDPTIDRLVEYDQNRYEIYRNMHTLVRVSRSHSLLSRHQIRHLRGLYRTAAANHHISVDNADRKRQQHGQQHGRTGGCISVRHCGQHQCHTARQRFGDLVGEAGSVAQRRHHIPQRQE